MITEAKSLDLDGVVFDRQIRLQFGALRAYQQNGVAIYEAPLTIPSVDNLPHSSLVLSPIELLSLRSHAARKVRTGVSDFLCSATADIYGNTGRANKKPWVEMTKKSLERAGISSYFQDIFFKPRGVSSTESKASRIDDLARKYGRVTHYDDDPLTLLRLARTFPGVNFVLVEDLSTSLLLRGVNLERDYPNVRRVAVLS